jgi:FAD:protein FMN transferase
MFRNWTLLIVLLIVYSCKQEVVYHKISGKTMGTYYSITYSGLSEINNVKGKVDSLLVEINDEVSTYISTSIISQFNAAKDSFKVSYTSQHFIVNFEKSLEIYHGSHGYFDPTVMPLVNYWGFGYTPKRAVTQVDSLVIDSLMTMVGFDRIQRKEDRAGSILYRKPAQSQLDFSAIAKGYGVDQVGLLFSNLGSKNYMVEIGGEVVTKGYSERQIPWLIGVNTPSYTAELTDLIEYLSLSGVGLASSGNYRNYHESNGQKYGHTISPKSGFPEINELLAVSVIAPDCMTADALATACMVMGYEKALTFINNMTDVSACFFIGTADGLIKTNYSDGFIQYVAKQ